MTEQQEEINVATGQTGQEAQRINIITNPSNGALKGNPPSIFNGDRSTTRRFINNFDLWKAINWHNNIMRKPFSRVITLLSYMDGTKVNAWKEEQMHKLQEAIDDRVQETDKDLWDSFIERFKLAYTNQNQREEAYQKLCKLKQGESLDDFFASFKQLANEAGVPLDDKGTIETLKHTMSKPLTRAVIQSPDLTQTWNIHGLSNNGKNRPDNPIRNGRLPLNSVSKNKDSTKPSDWYPNKTKGKITSTEETELLDHVPPLKEDMP